MLRVRQEAEEFKVEIQDLETTRITGNDVWHHMKTFDNVDEARSFALGYNMDIREELQIEVVVEEPEPAPVEEDPPASEVEEKPPSAARRAASKS